MGVVVGKLICPASTGSVTIDVNFRPSSVLFLATNQLSGGWEERTSDGSISLGIGSRDPNQTISNISWQHRYRAPDPSAKYLGGTGLYHDCCVQTMDTNVSIANRPTAPGQVRGSITAFTGSGFTFTWSHVISGRIVYYIAYGSDYTDDRVLIYGAQQGADYTLVHGEQGAGLIGFFGLGGNPLLSTTSSNVFGGVSFGEQTTRTRGGFSEFTLTGIIGLSQDRYWNPATGAQDLAVPCFQGWIGGSTLGGWTDIRFPATGSRWLQYGASVRHAGLIWATSSSDFRWRSITPGGGVGSTADLGIDREVKGVLLMGGSTYGGQGLSSSPIGGITFGISGRDSSNTHRDYAVAISKDVSTGKVIMARMEDRSWIASASKSSPATDVTAGTTSFPTPGTVRFTKTEDGTGGDRLGVLALGPFLGPEDEIRASFDQIRA